MFHYLSQNLVRVRAAWSATDRQTIFREMLALLLLISTAGFVGWSVIKVHKYCPEATSVTFLIGIILVTFFAAMGVNLMPTSDGSRLVHFVHRLRLWSTMSWARLVVAGGISLVICVLTYVCLFSALPKVQLAEDVTSLPDCAVGWSLVKVDCVNFPRHLWAPHGKISLFIGEDKVLPCSRNDKGLYRCTTQNASAEIAQRTTPAERLSQGPRKRLLVYLQRSKDLDYEHEILEGFRARLKLQLEDRYEIKFHEAQGSTESYWNSKDRWRAKANEIITGKDAPNVVVTVGSDAASAMTDFEVPERLAERLGPDFKGIYILGVSDPMRAGYARQTSRTGIPLRAVVRYGSGANDWAGTILKIFDTTRLRHKPEFIYDNVQKQDSWVAEEFASSPLNNADIKIRGPIQHALKVEDLEPGHVYFAWYALDALVDETPNSLADFLIVPSTYNKLNVQNFGVVVSVEDREIGVSGANLVVQALSGEAPEEMHIGQPAFRIWINCSAVERKKIPLSPTLRRSDIIFVEDEDGQEPRMDCVSA